MIEDFLKRVFLLRSPEHSMRVRVHTYAKKGRHIAYQSSNRMIILNIRVEMTEQKKFTRLGAEYSLEFLLNTNESHC